MKKLLMFGFAMTLFFCSCKEKLTANGNIISETRTLGTFTGIHTSGSTSIHLVYGNEYKVELKGSSNLIPAFETSVTNGKLYLNYRHVDIKRSDLEIFVTMPSVNNISLSGSATIDLAGNFPTLDFLALSISGSGNIVAKNNMMALKFNIDISGSGDADVERLVAEAAEVNISGSGSAHVIVQNKLKATISGSGRIYYSGHPQVETHISGSGKVIKF